MTTVFQRLINVAKDVTTLEVATTTSTAGVTLVPDLSEEQKTQLETARQNLLQKRTALSQVQSSDEAAYQAAKAAVQDADTQLSDLQDAFGAFDPSNTFARILAQLGNSSAVNLVAYSRFELDGDAVNYISNDDAYQSLVKSHADLVASSQASRTALFNFVKDVVDR